MKYETNNGQSVCKSQLNSSLSKACYSFSKSPRQVKSPLINDKFYEASSVISKRATSMGFGNKTDLVPKNFNPSPDKYSKASEFDMIPKKGTSFGLSRQDCKAVSLLPNLQIPGPGAYNIPNNNSKGFLMRGRDGFANIFMSTHNPGPGKYQIKPQTQKQYFIDSKRKSPFIYSFKKGKQNTGKQSKIGPGTYQIGLPSMGRQILANSRTQKSFIFSKQVRQTMHVQKSSVGPGSYGYFSEFGK